MIDLKTTLPKSASALDISSTSTVDTTSPKSNETNEFFTLFNQRIALENENIKAYSPLSVKLLWEIYDKIAIVYELALSPTVILKVRNKKTKEIFALKQIKKEKLHESYLHEFAKIECAVQYSIGKLSNLIVNVPQYFEDKDSYYIVMEYSKYHGYFEELLEKVR